jgi:hypothetical protein
MLNESFYLCASYAEEKTMTPTLCDDKCGNAGFKYFGYIINHLFVLTIQIINSNFNIHYQS